MRVSILLLFTFLLLGGSFISAQIPVDGLEAYYPFNSNADDASPNFNGGTFVNTNPIFDRNGTGQAFEFNGVDAFVEVPNNFDFPERTINLWFKVIDVNNYGAILDIDNPNLMHGYSKIYVEKVGGTIFLEAGFGLPHFRRAIEADRWYMVTVTRDANTTKVFLNCEPVDARPNSDNVSVDGDNGMRVATTRYYDRFFHGVIDDIRIYSRALEEREIAELYREGNVSLKNLPPVICDDPALMTPFCIQACVVCDIDGFTGRNVSEDFGELPPGFAGECTVFQHKAAWIAFIAGSTNLKISMSVENCTGGTGLELGIYAGESCGDFRRISNCHGGQTGTPITESDPRELEVFEELVIGQYYYIVMDATPNADNTAFTTCDWTLTVLEGSTSVFPLNDSGMLLGSESTCPGRMNTYTTSVDTGATDFKWTINGIDQNINNDSIDINFPSDGSYTLCIEASNICQAPPPTCRTIFVQSIPETTIDTFLCESDCIMIADTMICNGGNYSRTLSGLMACDSIVNINVTEIMTPVVNIDLNICEGDTFYIGDQPYTNTGQYQERLTTEVLCDSIVNLNLIAVVCNIESTSTATSVTCNGGNDGAIAFQVDAGTPPFTYSWSQIGTTNNGSGNIGAINENTVLTNLSPGQYGITINDGFGNLDIIIDEVSDPDPLLLTLITSDYNGQNISCPGASDGTITSMVSGGMEPYQYGWSSGADNEIISNLGPDMYTLIVTDALGCSIETSIVLSEPMPLDLILESSDPNCDGLTTGEIEIASTIGGTAPYRYSINGLSWQAESLFNNLTEGNYEIVVEDINGCIEAQATILDAPEIPVIDIGADQVLGLGDSVDIRIQINTLNNPTITWTPEVFLSCADCLLTNARPTDPILYTVAVTSQDGCIDVDSIFIDVQKFRKFYAPNAFSPDQDGANDVFYINGGSEVAGIVSMKIFDRWGNQLYTVEQIPDNEPSVGWDGTFNGKLLNTGIYIWVAEILFIDGETINYTGDITLLR